MSHEQRKAIEMLVYTEMSQQEIADKIGITRQTLYNWRKREDFSKELQAELDFKTQFIRNRFKRDIDRVYDKVYDIAVNSSDESTSLRAGQFILEQVLGKAQSNLDIKTQQNIIETKVDKGDILELFEDDDNV